jgi:hypothetical protein
MVQWLTIDNMSQFRRFHNSFFHEFFTIELGYQPPFQSLAVIIFTGMNRSNYAFSTQNWRASTSAIGPFPFGIPALGVYWVGNPIAAQPVIG